jgi:hypothetical protein
VGVEPIPQSQQVGRGGGEGASASRLCPACSRQHGAVPEAPSSVYEWTGGTSRAADGSGRRLGEGSPCSRSGLRRRPLGAYVIYAQRVRALRDAGYQQLVFCLVPGYESALEDWARVVETI